MQLTFTKMTALGNDFIMIDGDQFSVEDIAPFTQQLCDRHFGIGADGVIFILPPSNSSVAHAQMRIFNSDGSEAQMCGNGIRCFAHYLLNRGAFSEETLLVETLAGILSITKSDTGYTVDMGAPQSIATAHQIVETSQGGFSLLPISMGNPHAVIFTNNITDELVVKAGPEIEKDTLFPEKTNVEFCSIIDRTSINMRVWERGCGETLACGTGACAAVVAGITQKLLNTHVVVHLLGGKLSISWSGNTEDSVIMSGEAHTVFTGTIEL